MEIEVLKQMVLDRLNNPIVRATTVYTLASVLNALIPFILMPVLTVYLSPAEYGIASTFIVCNTIALLFVGIEQQGFVSVSYYTTNKERLQKTIPSILVISVLLCTLLCSLTFIAPSFLESLVILKSEWILVAVLAAMFQFVSQVNLTLWQLEQRPRAYGAFQILNSLVNYSISVALIVLLNMNSTGRIMGIVAAAGIFGIYSFFLLRRKGLISKSIDRSIIKASLAFSLPLLPHALAGWVNSGLDRILINNFIDVEQNGLYSVGYQIAMVIGMIASSFNRAFMPFVFKNLSVVQGLDESKRQIVRYTYYYYTLLTLLAVLLYGTSPWIMQVLVDESFHNAQSYIPWIIFGFWADGLYYGVVNFIYYSKRTYFISLVTFSSCVIHFAVSYFYIPVYGAIAAAYATAISYLFSFIVTFIIGLKIYPMPWFALIKKS